MAKTAIALTIAGSDPSGGAGIQADLKTMSALGVYGASVITALTAQNTRGVTGVHGVPADFITQQLDMVAADLRLDAVKTGMLGDTQTVITVSEGLRRHNLRPLVVDPVMVATSGDVLLAPDAIDAVRRHLIPLADIITPNLPEGARLLDARPAANIEDMEAQARALIESGANAVLLKGGHGGGGEAIDVFATRERIVRLSAPRIETTNTHGTGCTLAAAITSLLARGRTLEDAVRGAKDYVWHALKAGIDLGVGSGAGPVDHLFSIRSSLE